MKAYLVCTWEDPKDEKLTLDGFLDKANTSSFAEDTFTDKELAVVFMKGSNPEEWEKIVLYEAEFDETIINPDEVDTDELKWKPIAEMLGDDYVRVYNIRYIE